MARITIPINREEKARHSVHEGIRCTYFDFNENGQQYLQMDTFAIGQEGGGAKQIIQLDEEAARQLKQIIELTFPNLQ